MEKELAECFAANRIYRIYEGGITMFRKLLNGRRKLVTLAFVALAVVAITIIGLGVVGVKNEKAPSSVVLTRSALVPIFTENSLPPVAAFEQLAPFDITLDTRGWKIIPVTAALLDIPVPGGYIWEIEQGFAIVRVDKDGQIFVRDAQFELVGAIPVADDKGNVSFVQTKLTVLGVDDEPIRFPTKTGMRTASQIGKIDKEGFFHLPWIVRVRSDQIPQPFTLYFDTWGFLGKDVIAADVSFGDFGTMLGFKNLPNPVEQGVRVLLQRRASTGEPPIEPEPEIWCIIWNINIRAVPGATDAFVRKLLSNLHKITDEGMRHVARESLLFISGLLKGR